MPSTLGPRETVKSAVINCCVTEVARDPLTAEPTLCLITGR